MWYDKRVMVDTLLISLILVMMFILGAVFGSFACCQAWRWRYHVLHKKELGQWSVCLHCKKRIKWYDNIPIVSWLVLRGKCRYCHKAYLVPILENWNILALKPELLALQLGVFIVTLMLLVVLMVLAVYDAKWGELPTVLLILAIVIGAIVWVLKMYELSLTDDGDVIGGLWNSFGAVMILAGTCFVIYKASKEKLMGSGDWLLALALALPLASWWLALWTIFLANLLGDVIVLPTALKSGNKKVHFGPFLVAAFVIVLVLGNCLPLLLKAL